MKNIFILVFTLFLVIASTKLVYSQEDAFDFNKAYQDFVFTYDQYQKEHSDYELARSQYLQSDTLAAKSKAQNETYEMLSARDEVVKTYLTALRMRLAQAIGVPQEKREVLFGRIDSEVEWYDTHKNSLSSASTLEDQTDDSNAAHDQYKRLTQLLIYEILTEIAAGKEYFMRQEQISIVARLREKLNEIRVNGDLDTERLDRDLLEVENKITRSEEKQTDIQKAKTTMQRSQNPQTSYNQILFRLKEAVQYLKEANTYLNQIMLLIKTG